MLRLFLFMLDCQDAPEVSLSAAVTARLAKMARAELIALRESVTVLIASIDREIGGRS